VGFFLKKKLASKGLATSVFFLKKILADDGQVYIYLKKYGICLKNDFEFGIGLKFVLRFF
jgi:hypothetical protein